MSNIFNYISITTIGFNTLVLDTLSISAIIIAICVIVSKNPIVSVLNLIGLFFFIAFILILMGVNFIGIAYILVYVGAVSILFLFILMLINIRVSELASYSVNSLLLAFIVGLLFLSIVYFIIPNEFIKNFNINETIPYVNYNDWEINVFYMGNILSLGNIMYSSYSILLIISSIILLLAMVGTIVITLKAKDFYTIYSKNEYILSSSPLQSNIINIKINKFKFC